mmetsp:Transcript_56513/g.129788  ORF Transcript_56513/g.129788 Transcript_56513/m.129788 type:complete len:134 (-) Transcript_56513:367-768(-)
MKRAHQSDIDASKRLRTGSNGEILSPLAPLANLSFCSSAEPICLICRGLLIQKCALCISAPSPASMTSPCMLSFGGCGCVYHHHCLAPWLEKRPVCPYDECAWQPVAPRLCVGLTGVAPQPLLHGRRTIDGAS